VLFGNGAQLAMMTLDDALNSFDQNVVEMPTVRYLPGVWRTERGATGIDVATVSADDLHTGVILQPYCPAFGGAVGQQVDGAMTLQVNDQGAVTFALAVSPVVHANHTRRCACWHTGAAQQSQKRVWAGPHPQRISQSRAAFAPCGQRDKVQSLR